jgi:hypothetical protein
MPLLEHELARRTNDQIELRAHPMRVKWMFMDAMTADGHDIHCAFECSVRALPDPTERRMLQEVLLHGREQVTSEMVSAHFHRPLRAGLRSVVESTATEQVLSDAGRKLVLDALKSAAGPVAFASGLELLPPFQVDVESPGYQQERIREMQRTTVERNAAGQVEHLQRAGELLQQFNSLRRSSPELSAGQVLQQINPADRGSVLQSLLHASAKQERATHLWAVAGPYLVRIDPREDPPATQLIPLPPTVGPLRSVQPADIDGQRVLLIGAQSGFMLVRPDATTEPEVYVDPLVHSQLGFSRVIHWNNSLGFAACHGEAGIVRWTTGNTSQPDFRLSVERLRELFPAASTTATPRNLQAILGGGIVFSFGNVLIAMDSEARPLAIPTSSPADIVAIISDGRQLVVAHEDGLVCSIDRTTAEILRKQRTGSRIRAAGALPWLGSTRLLLAGDDGSIQCLGVDDPLVTQYASAHHAPRVVAGSTDRVAAISSDRQRLILWNAWDGQQPAAEIYLTGLTRHRIADIDFA